VETRRPLSRSLPPQRLLDDDLLTSVLRLWRVHLVVPAIPMSASVIGRLRSSAFRLSTTAVSMSLAGSCFSPGSALWPFHHGIRGRGGTIC